MLQRTDRKCGLLYPEDRFMTFWDPFVVVLLFGNCIMMPYMIAFDSKDMSLHVISSIIDLLFLTDIIIIFNTAYYDEDFQIVYDRVTIAINYFKSGWLAIDVLAIFPFDLLNGDHFFLSSSEEETSKSTN